MDFEKNDVKSPDKNPTPKTNGTKNNTKRVKRRQPNLPKIHNDLWVNVNSNFKVGFACIFIIIFKISLRVF